MKHIQKQSTPHEMVQWKKTPNEDWQPTFQSLRGTKTGVVVKQALIKEQGALCCYCECQISEDDSHFEHFRPRDGFAELELDYSNLLCSCIREPKRDSDLHCGHYKGNWFDEKMLISPLDSGCEHRFKYNSHGKIEPADEMDQAAITTICKLGLNCSDLLAKRKALIDVFNGAGRGPLTVDDIDQFSLNDQRDYAKKYLLPKEDGMYNEFWTTIDYLRQQLPTS